MADDKKKAASRSEDGPARESGEDQVQDRMDEIQEQGFLGEEVDPTPNENYTVRGVTSGKPTPETDADAANRARQHVERNRAR